MRGPLAKWYRDIRFGEPIIVVSGLPRSGTSMAMSMLAAGGMRVMSDGVRAADASNPRGYFELERVKTLNVPGADKSWLRDARGRAVKIVSFLLRDLPTGHQYRVILLHRRMTEILASQRAMLTATGAVDDTPDDRLAAAYARHLAEVNDLLATQSRFSALHVEHADVIQKPGDQAERMARFVGASLDVAKMASAVEQSLYRSR